MLLHDLRLALGSLKRNPVLCLLMISAIAVGMAASMIAVTLYHARAGNPIPWKNDTLYAVMLDTRDNTPPQALERHPEYPPDQLTYRDARALYASKIPVHAVMMFPSSQVLVPSRAGLKPFDVNVRVTTADFFATFDVPFTYGSGWSRADDDAPAAVVVLSRFMNQKLFGGANSVGREVDLDGYPYRVVGVLAAWMPRPRYYDLHTDHGGFDIPEDIYMPFGWMQVRKLMTSGDLECVSMHARITGFDSLLTQECVWLQYWVQLRGRADRDRFQAFVDSYTDEERAHGRFPRKNNNRIVDVPTWLAMHDVVGDDSRLQLALGFAFLAVSVLNTAGLMLAKFVHGAPVAGLRRALGARRVDIIRQHVIEAVVVCLIGGAVGLALTCAGLEVLKGLLFAAQLTEDNPDSIALVQSLVHMDTSVLGVAFGLSLLTGVLAGLYPAYRVGRLAPASFLKTQ